MNDPVSMARAARERLAQALGALQSPGVPAHLLDAAEPVAQAMSALHRIESSPGSVGGLAPQALDSVRRALSGLQAHAAAHPAVGHAVESVAGSLNLVHQLATASGAGAAAPHQPVASTTQASGLDATQLAQHAVPQPAPARPMAQQPAPARPMAQQPAPARPMAQQPMAPPVAQPAPAWPMAQQPMAPQPMAPQPMAPPVAQPAPFPQPPAAPAHAGPGASAPAGGMVRVDAELGAHSPTNFYKGLSGNDVIEAGGIFISTYQIPSIGQPLLIHVTMPGGYEFEAKGVVRWTREAPHSSRGETATAPPGYGAQFTEISPEGRQLVYRYTRNREPLFHDDF